MFCWLSLELRGKSMKHIGKASDLTKLVFMKSGETPELTKNASWKGFITKDLGYQTGKILRQLQQTMGVVPTSYHHH
jgi:hypothetical protein